MLQRGNAYHIRQSPLADAGAWEPDKNRHQKSVNWQMQDACVVLDLS